MFSGVNFSYLSKRNRWVFLLEGSSCFFVFRSQSLAVSTPFDKGKVMKRICVNPLKRDNNIRYVLFKLTNRKQLWVSTYHGAKNSTNIISSPFTPSLKSLSPSSITSEQKTADANKGIKIVEIIILKQNGEDEIIYQDWCLRHVENDNLQWTALAGFDWPSSGTCGGSLEVCHVVIGGSVCLVTHQHALTSIWARKIRNFPVGCIVIKN